MGYLFILICMLIIATVIYVAIQNSAKKVAEKTSELFKNSESAPYNNTEDITSADYITHKFTRNFATSATLIKHGGGAIMRKFLELLPNAEVFAGFSPYIIDDSYKTEKGKLDINGQQIDFEYQGRLIIEGKSDDGHPVWVQVNWTAMHESAVENGDEYKEVINDDTYVKRIDSIYLVFPKTLRTQIKHETLRQLVKQAKMKMKIKLPVHRAALYNVVEYRGQWNINQSSATMQPAIPEGAINIFYNPAEFKLGDRKFSVPMSDYLNLCQMWLLRKNPVSAAFYGYHGTGKSYLIEQLAYMVAQNEKVRVIHGSKELLEAINSPSFNSFKERVFNPYYYNIILIDEAEELFLDNHVKATLKNLLSGSLQKSLNASAIIAFNGEPSDYDDALFRAGRCIAVDVTPIKVDVDKERVAAASEVITKITGEPFNAEHFTSYRKENKKDNKGNVICPSGYITLGDLFNCHQEDFEKLTQDLMGNLAKSAEKYEVGKKVTLDVIHTKNKK